MNVAVLERASHSNGVDGLRTEKVFVTPQMAAAWLEKNADNRKVIPGHLKSLEAFFRRGEMKLNGQTIKFSVTGRLLDGQHRLMACANTGVGFWTLVVYGLEEDSFDTIDVGGKPRQVRDILGIRGEANARDLAAALNLLNEFSQSKGGFYDGRSRSFSVAVADQLLNRHPMIRESVTRLSTHRNFLWRNATCYCLHYLFSLSDETLAEDFAMILIEGASDIDRPFNRFRESLIRTDKLKARHTMRVNAARAIKSFNYEKSGNRPRVIVWRDGESFPQIDGLEMSAV
jgi:hypothetical protein